MDSSVFIAWIKGEYRNGVACQPIVEHILGQAERGDCTIGMSTLVLVEVHKTRTGPMLTLDEDERILRYFEHSYFDVIDLDREIAEEANRLCRQYGLKPNIRCEEPERKGQLPLSEDATG